MTGSSLHYKGEDSHNAYLWSEACLEKVVSKALCLPDSKLGIAITDIY